MPGTQLIVVVKQLGFSKSGKLKTLSSSRCRLEPVLTRATPQVDPTGFPDAFSHHWIVSFSRVQSPSRFECKLQPLSLAFRVKHPRPSLRGGVWGAGGARGLGVASVSPSSFGAASGSPPGLRGRADSGRGVVKGLGSYLIAVRAARRWRSLWGRDTNVLLSLGALWVLRRFP